MSPAVSKRLRLLASAVSVLVLLWTADLALRHDLEGEVAATLEREAQIIREGLPDEPEAAQARIYRIAQETLQNVLKHADADEVTVRLACGSTDVRLTLADDGAGFDVAERAGTGHGLASVRERAELVGGTVRVTSRPGTGTSVTVTAPIDSSSID